MANKIFITGDYHGGHSANKRYITDIKAGVDDYYIIAGDLGIPWFDKDCKRDQKALKGLLYRSPGIILFVDGNHDNFNRLNALPTKTLFGAPVGILHERVFHLRRGYVYEIAGRSIFAFGGGVSIDRHLRTIDINWWPQEIPNHAEIERGLNSLGKVNYKVDIVLTHEAPDCALTALRIPPMPEWQTVRTILNQFESMIDYKIWCFGHYHMDIRNERYKALQDDIIEI